MASQYKNLFFDLDDTLLGIFLLNARDTFEEMYHKYDYGRFLFVLSSISIRFISIVM